MKKRLISSLLALALISIPPLSFAEDDTTVSGDKTTDMVVDLVLIRPLGLATTIVGTALTIIALPFTLPSGSVNESAQAMIVKPAEYTFKRPLGQFDTGRD